MTLFPETSLVRLARRSRYRHHWAVDLLIAILILIISISVQGAFSLPILLISLFLPMLNGGYAFEDLPSLMQSYESSAGYSLLSLFLTAGLILIPILYCTVLERRSLESLGFIRRNAFLEYAAGLVVGFVMLSLSLGICLVTRSASVTKNGSDPLLTLAFFFGYMVQGMSEEVFCRGYLLQTLSIRNKPWFAILTSSLFFAALHLLNNGITVLAFINLFLFGVFAAVYLWRRGSIWGIAAVHCIWNYTQGNLYGIPVSGTNSGPSLLTTEFVPSCSLLNGGAFGLEGGLAVTAVLVLFTGILLFLPPAIREGT